MIQFRSVTKKYKNDHYALKNINLDIMSGEFVFIVGASGAGKSTLMKLLYNEERPTSGTVTIGGINIANLSNDKVPNLRRCMGIVFQDYKLLQNQSVYDNVAYVIRTLGISSKEINARVSGALKIVGLYDKMNATPSELSGGEQQMLAMGRALMARPKILLLDEPTNDLDVETLRALEEALLNFPGCAVVISHDRWFLDRIATHILAFEGDSQVTWFEGNYSDYEDDYKRRHGNELHPQRIKYKRLKS